MIQTQRLFLRELTQDDREALFAVLGDAHNMRYYPYLFDEERVQNWIDRNLERYRTLGFGLWAVCLKQSGELIRDCGLTMQQIDGSIRPEIGYHIRRDMQKRGYAKEAAIAVRDWTFCNTPFGQVYSYMKAENEASAATARAYGCRYEHTYLDKDGEKTCVYVLNREDAAK